MKSLIQLARQNPNNLNTTFYLYTGWMPSTESGTEFYDVWHDDSPMDPDADLLLKASSLDWVHDQLISDPDLSGADIQVVPVSGVLAELDRRMTLGEITGFAGVEDLYRDEQHMNNLGWFVASNTMLSSLFKRNPTGIPTNSEYVLAPGQTEPIEITPELGALMQDAVWDVVRSHPYTGTLAGDINGDGLVGITDLNSVLSEWNTAVGLHADADPSGDGFVGIDDLNVVLGNWNAGVVPPTNVPEPAVGLFLLAPLLVCGRRNRRRGSRNPIAQNKVSRVSLYTATLALAVAPAQSAHATETVINQGTRDWVAAATTGRADMLILGDSITNHRLGWTGGIANAARTRLGLAGTGMLALGNPAVYPGYGGASFDLSLDWLQPTLVLPDDLEHYAIGSKVSVLNSDAPSPKFWLSHGLYDSLMDRSRAYDWQLWVSATGGVDGTIQGLRASRLQSPFTRTVLETSPSVPVSSLDTTPQLVEFSFAEAPGEVSDWHEYKLFNTSRDMAVFYNRLIDPNATGVTVTGWGYPGGTMNDFITDLYDNGRLDQAGRAAYLSALVHGNSGKLNVVIAMGVNDTNENEASVTQGITPGDSVEAYIDNIQTQIALVTADWAAAGLPANDLSFTLPSSYQMPTDPIGNARVERLLEYRDALEAMAQADTRISFLDIWDASPTAEQAVADNHIHDGVHPSLAGSMMYGAIFMDELLESTPIPGDLDGDGFVGIEDLNLILANWNVQFELPWNLIQGPNDYRADPTFDSFVGIDDLNTVLPNWNAGTPPGTSASTTNPAPNAPEPASMFVFACLLGLLYRRV